jgi:hypothetical protein
MKWSYIIGIVLIIIVLYIYGPIAYVLYLTSSPPTIGSYVTKDNITIGVDDMSIRYNTNVPCARKGSEFFYWTPIEAKPDWKFVELSLLLKNSGSNPIGLGSFYIKDEYGAIIQPYPPNCTTTKDSAWNLSKTVSKGEFQTFVLIYEIPLTSTPSTFHYSINGGSFANGEISLKLDSIRYYMEGILPRFYGM